MNKIKIVGWNGAMDFPHVEFEHALRVLANKAREFKRKPNEKERQLALFRALQTTKLLYSDISRMGEAENNYGIEKLNRVARNKRNLLSIEAKPSPILRSIRKQWKSICNIATYNHKNARSLSKRARATRN